MGYNARNDEIHDNIVRMQRALAAERYALATVRRFNAKFSADGSVWFWPKIVAALVSKHHWLAIACVAGPWSIYSVLHFVIFGVRASMGTAARALSRCRVIRRYKTT